MVDKANITPPILSGINCSTLSFMRNPVMGGKPARFIIRIGRFNVAGLFMTTKMGAEANT